MGSVSQVDNIETTTVVYSERRDEKRESWKRNRLLAFTL